jgi:hypothetical protein
MYCPLPQTNEERPDLVFAQAAICQSKKMYFFPFPTSEVMDIAKKAFTWDGAWTRRKARVVCQVQFSGAKATLTLEPNLKTGGGRCPSRLS